MKKILAVLLITLSFYAIAAGIIADMPNEGGGNISLTDIPCTTIKDTFVAYSNLPNGKAILGCWTGDDTNVFVRWSDGEIRLYPMRAFTVKKKGWL